MLKKVRKYLALNRLPPSGANIVAACSGGPDSLALVHVLHCLRQEGFWHGGLAVAHVNHQLRPEAGDEADFVADFCRDLGLVCHRTKVDVTAYLRRYRRSPQEAARLLRYEALQEIAARWGGALVATGHHRDDQAETVLLQLFRGAGLDGLKGMRPLQGNLLRPLLAVARADIEAYCEVRGWHPCQDRSNQKTDYLRNRLRLELLPVLAREYNPRIWETLDRTATILGDAQDYLGRQAAAFLQRANPGTAAEEFFLPTTPFRDLHIALQREVLRQWIEKKRGSLTGISFAHVEKLLEMVLAGRVGSRLELPGGFLIRREYAGVIAGGSPLDDGATAGIKEPLLLRIPGTTELSTLGMGVTARLFTDAVTDELPSTVVFDLERLKPPLYVRTRRGGDRFAPCGMIGTKKLQDYFVDAKILQGERDRIPLICDQAGIIWIAGLRRTRRGQPDEASRQFVQLTLNKL